MYIDLYFKVYLSFYFSKLNLRDGKELYKCAKALADVVVPQVSLRVICNSRLLSILFNYQDLEYVLSSVSLCCIVLCSIALRCIVLCCVALSCVLSYRVVLCCFAFLRVALHRVVFHCLCCVMLCCVALSCVSSCCFALRCVVSCFFEVRCVVLRCVALCNAGIL